MFQNQTSQNSILFSSAVEQFLFAKRSQRLSNHTIRDYERTFRRFSETLPKDLPVSEITPFHIRRFLASLTCSKKTLLNTHVGLSSLWSWMVKENLCQSNIMKKVDRPRPEIRAIIPFSQDEVKKLFASIKWSSTYSRPGKRETSHRLKDYFRNRAIMLVLLDTGMRASELCGLRFSDFIDRSRIRVFGKGSKERILPLSPATIRSIDDYVKYERITIQDQGEYIFVTANGKKMRADDLYHRISKIGERAGIHSHPHRFRHTFAINFLRNGGDIYSLQAMLGHSSLEMVKRYLAIARADVEMAHRKASPVINWCLE